jgi:hypothetical protein
LRSAITKIKGRVGRREKASRRHSAELCVGQKIGCAVGDVASHGGGGGCAIAAGQRLDYLAMMAASYGMEPNDFIKQISNSGQVPAYVSELARRKAVDFLVANADIADTNGKKVEYQA